MTLRAGRQKRVLVCRSLCWLRRARDRRESWTSFEDSESMRLQTPIATWRPKIIEVKAQAMADGMLRATEFGAILRHKIRATVIGYFQQGKSEDQRSPRWRHRRWPKERFDLQSSAAIFRHKIRATVMEYFQRGKFKRKDWKSSKNPREKTQI